MATSYISDRVLFKSSSLTSFVTLGMLGVTGNIMLQALLMGQ